MYYLRTKPAASAIQFTVDKSKLKKAQEADGSPARNGTTNGSKNGTPNGSTNGSMDRMVEEQRRNMEAMVCSLQNKDDCLMCGS